MTRRLLFAILGASLLASFPAPGAAPVPRWRDLGHAEQAILAPLASDWDSFDADRRRRWVDLAARYPSMTVDEQTRMRARMAYWGSLTPQERLEARERYKRLQNMPADQRETLRRQWETYESLSPEERKRLAESRSAGTKSPGSAAATPVRK
ncbi:DUF3106 domain-containing protein [Methyloversatilis sp.]|uniref:DUF3106 domain-containing protein n=1 Tax=Methyloversatilis sp. TaxID=2569862 RepID=UPI0035AF7DA2